MWGVAPPVEKSGRGMGRTYVKNPVTAGVLSLLVPGVGQWYNGKFLRGLFWLLATPGLWLGTGGTLGWICHIVSAVTAYSYANRLSVR